MMDQGHQRGSRNKLSDQIGFGRELTHSLWFDAHGPRYSHAKVENLYRHWLASAPNAGGVCFCELAYFLDYDSGHAASMRAAPTRELLDAYDQLANDFLKSETSLFSSGEFQSGLMLDDEPSFFCSRLPAVEAIGFDRKCEFSVKITRTFEGLGPSQSIELGAEAIWQAWVHACSPQGDVKFVSSNGRGLRTLVAIPVLVPSDLSDHIATFAGAVFAGLDDSFDCPEQFASIIQYLLLHSISVAALPAYRKRSQGAQRRHFSHLIQRQINQIFPAVNSAADVDEKTVAMIALRRIKFGVDLFDDRALVQSPEPDGIDLTQCIEDACRISLDRLSSRAASQAKALDHFFTAPINTERQEQQTQLKQRLNSFIKNSWIKDSSMYFRCLGFSHPELQLETQFSKSFVSGTLVFALTQVFFHSAIFAAHHFEQECRRINAGDETTPMEELVYLRTIAGGIEIANRAFCEAREFWTGNDGRTLEHLRQRYRLDEYQEAPVEFGFDQRGEQVWFFIRMRVLTTAGAA